MSSWERLIFCIVDYLVGNVLVYTQKQYFLMMIYLADRRMEYFMVYNNEKL